MINWPGFIVQPWFQPSYIPPVVEYPVGPPLLGIDPYAGGAIFPADAGNIGGQGFVTGIDPNTIDVGLPEDPNEITVEAPIAAQWQATRNVRLANNLNQKVTLNLIYQTLSEDGNTVEGESEVELDPGEVADLYENDWRVNAMQVRFSAVAADGTVLRRLNDQWVDIVPETDEAGIRGYPSSTIQTQVISLR